MAGLIGSDKWIEDLKEKFPKQTYSARIANNGTATITSVDHDFIESVTRTATGTVDIVWKSGVFTVAPMVTATQEANNKRTVTIVSTSSTGCTILVELSDTGADSDSNFGFVVTKQGADAE